MRIVLCILVAALTLTVAGAAMACDAVKTASASSGSSCASKAKLATAEIDCDYCDLVADLKSNKDNFTVSTIDSKNGVTIVFAAMNDDAVEATQAVASKAYGLMSAPAHCDYTRAKMADASCDGCKEGIGAFADASVSFENTEHGAWARVETKDKESLKQLQAFFAEYTAEEAETEAEG